MFVFEFIYQLFFKVVTNVIYTSGDSVTGQRDSFIFAALVSSSMPETMSNAAGRLLCYGVRVFALSDLVCHLV